MLKTSCFRHHSVMILRGSFFIFCVFCRQGEQKRKKYQVQKPIIFVLLKLKRFVYCRQATLTSHYECVNHEGIIVYHILCSFLSWHDGTWVLGNNMNNNVRIRGLWHIIRLTCGGGHFKDFQKYWKNSFKK